MNLYKPKLEENIELRRKIQTWKRSGFVTEAQTTAFNNKLTDPYKKTNVFLRFLLFGFTGLCLVSTVLFVSWLGDFKSDGEVVQVAFVFGLIAVWYADFLIRKKALYRHGIEEALTMVGTLFLCWTITHHVDDAIAGHKIEILSLGAAFFLLFGLVYFRYGWIYAKIGSQLGIFWMFGIFNFSKATGQIVVLCLIGILLAYEIYHQSGLRYEFQINRSKIHQVLLLFALYFSTNLKIIYYYDNFPAVFYWMTYVATFLIPGICLWIGFRKRQQHLIDIGLLLSVLTLITNKSYLGMKRYDWDPMIMGTLLIGLSLWAIRWFNKDKNKTHYGYTSINLLKPENHGLDIAVLAATMAPAPGSPTGSSSSTIGESGQSGGGGASGSY